MTSPWRVFALALVCVFSPLFRPVLAATNRPMTAYHLTVNHRSIPIGVNDLRPHFGWFLKSSHRGECQTAYRIRVDGKLDTLEKEGGCVWDSGKVQSGNSVDVEYGGPPLRSAGRYYWEVQVWDRFGRPSEWSEPSWWEMGLLHARDWSARWIGAPETPGDTALPLLARDFTLDKPIQRARLYVTGLGRYEARLNGKAVTSSVLEPADTDYRKTVQYAIYDVTGLLREGPNTLGILLGNGLYNAAPTPGRYQKLAGPPAPLKAFVQMSVLFTDGTMTRIVSDGTWRAHPGPITFSSHYGGEDYDARREMPGWDAPGFDRSAWPRAILTKPPKFGPRLEARHQPPIRIIDTFPAVSVAQPKPGVFVVDMGRNFAGWPEIRVSGPAGTAVKLRPSEILDSDGMVDQSTTGSPIWDTYTLKGEGLETWHPHFMYHGFRYLEVTGWPGTPQPGDFRGLLLHTANEPVGSFVCSNPLLNSIHGLIDAAVVSNMFSVLTDCPHREKLGWLEVSHLMFRSIAFNYDVAAWYSKLFADMADAQTPEGLVPDIAPEYTVFNGGFRDDPNWGGAYVLGPWYVAEATGDTRALRRHFAGMQRYVDYLSGKAKGHILSHGLGDWITVDNSTPVSIVSTATYYRQARALSEMAAMLGEKEAVAKYARLAGEIFSAFNATFFHPDTQTYGSGSQACNALALHAGLVPEEHRKAVLDALVASIQAHGNHVTVGEIALPSLIQALSENGRNDVVYAFATQTTNPSYGYQVVHGATTLTEAWDGPTAGLSQNHCMLGHLEEWFYDGLAGIRGTSPGYATLRIRPYVPDGLGWVSARTRTVRGLVASDWQAAPDGRFTLKVQIPVNSTAEVWVPAADAASVMESGVPAGQADGIAFRRMDSGCAVYEVGSGAYTFTSHR